MKLNKAPLIILSSPRSGSSLLHHTLSFLPEIAPLPPDSLIFEFISQPCITKNNFGKEHKLLSKYIDYCAKFGTKFSEKLKNNLYEIESSAKNHDIPDWKSFVKIIAIEYSKTINKDIRKCSIICEKSPSHIYFQKNIRAIYPDAKFLYLRRDPRDIVASLNYRNWATHNVVTNALNVKTECEKMTFDNSIKIKYEDFITYPIALLQKIGEFLELNYSDTFYQQILKRKEENADNETYKFEQKIYSQNINRWHGILSTVDKEVEIVESICNKVMKQGGYPLAGNKKNLRFYEIYWMYYLGEMISRGKRFFRWIFKIKVEQ